MARMIMRLTVVLLQFYFAVAAAVGGESVAPNSMPTEFSNPVCNDYLADPYCFLHEGTYYAIGTGAAEAADVRKQDRVIPMVKSSDLQHWQEVGSILESPSDERGGSFWAPEIGYESGVFYLYYHASGNGHGFRIRVATSRTPEGPYVDVGKPMTDVLKNSFAIDSDMFRDDDGQWYLFYATDFYDSNATTFRGTALVVDRMKSMTELEGHPQVVMRAHWQWQIYQRNRLMGGKIADWYTLEGPSVVKRGGKYYCFYSGGNYQNDTYGVDYLVADKITGPWRETGEFRGPQIMRSVPGKVIGPGHNSIVTSPDARQDYIVYHAWNPTMTVRQMWIDPLLWTESGPVVKRFAERIEACNREAEEQREAGQWMRTLT